MADHGLRKLAEVLVGYSTEIRPGDLVRIEGHPTTTPLILELYRAALGAGAHPAAQLVVDEAVETLLAEGSDEQVEWLPLDVGWNLEHGDVWIALDGPENTKHLSGVDPAKMARRLKAREPYQARYLERSHAGEFRWVLCAYPSEAAAQEAQMSLGEFEAFLHRAAFLEADDPVAEWKAFGARLERIGSHLDGVSELRVVAADTDLSFDVGGRTWIRSSGKTNLPDGEIFTGPVETSVNGTIRFNFPAVIRGRHIDDVQLRFEGGEVVEATAARGEDFLREMIDLDDGARRVGEFAFGLNDAVTDHTGSVLLDEKIGGSVHLALGRSIVGTGGENVSALHWDMVCDLRSGSEVYADGELVYRNGRFLDGVA
ncbi:MAG TPA: aminopeptidase [Gaiellaceae bacterium]|nr:aminopeptidase [Gaiellaceae bacterium]